MAMRGQMLRIEVMARTHDLLMIGARKKKKNEKK